MALAGRIEVNPAERPREVRHLDYEVSVREQQAWLEEIHQHLRDREARLEVAETTRTPLGQELHWIDLESQVEIGKVAEPPSEDEPLIARHDGKQAGLPLTSELERPGAELGPPGTVPVIKRPLDKIHPRGTLQDFLAK